MSYDPPGRPVKPPRVGGSSTSDLPAPDPRAFSLQAFRDACAVRHEILEPGTYEITDRRHLSLTLGIPPHGLPIGRPKK